MKFVDNLKDKLSLHPLSVILFAVCLVLGAVALFLGHSDYAMMLGGIMAGTLAPALVRPREDK